MASLGPAAAQCFALAGMPSPEIILSVKLKFEIPPRFQFQIIIQK
jgi:hypothetical protein